MSNNTANPAIPAYNYVIPAYNPVIPAQAGISSRLRKPSKDPETSSG
ncbi:hypothetical protein P8S54_00570 [Thiomicrospira sp. R3]|nr:hypothetical protein [Thiomicrospira sp. R3]WFE68825.1 hypothetical protein P8S54_00570 [Thiomicrospira sp. R3]